jgi:hypothetical protein
MRILLWCVSFFFFLGWWAWGQAELMYLAGMMPQASVYTVVGVICTLIVGFTAIFMVVVWLNEQSVEHSVDKYEWE